MDSFLISKILGFVFTASRLSLFRITRNTYLYAFAVIPLVFTVPTAFFRKAVLLSQQTQPVKATPTGYCCGLLSIGLHPFLFHIHKSEWYNYRHFLFCSSAPKEFCYCKTPLLHLANLLLSVSSCLSFFSVTILYYSSRALSRGFSEKFLKCVKKLFIFTFF